MTSRNAWADSLALLIFVMAMVACGENVFEVPVEKVVEVEVPVEKVGEVEVPVEKVVEVPVRRFWEGGGATFAALDALGVLDRLVGVNTRTSGHKNYFLPDVVARVTQDDIFEETSYGDDLELILNGDPDVYFQYNGDDWRNNALQVGVPAIHYSPFSEGPLGSAEQVKFVSLFFNLEARANRYFEPIAEEYNMVKSLAQGQSESPSVLLGTIARSGQFQSRNRTRLESVLIEDAGGARPLLKAVDQGLLDGTAHLASEASRWRRRSNMVRARNTGSTWPICQVSGMFPSFWSATR